MRKTNQQSSLEYIETYYYTAVVLGLLTILTSILLNIFLESPVQNVLMMNIAVACFLSTQLIFRNNIKVKYQILISSNFIIIYGGYLFYAAGSVSNGLYLILAGLILTTLFLELKYSVFTISTSLFMIAFRVFGVGLIRQDYFHLVGLVLVYLILTIGVGLVRTHLKEHAHQLEIINQDLVVEKTKIEKMAYYEQLTGLPNRKHFSTLLQESVVLSDKGLLVLLNIRDFHKVNEVNGYKTGDAILKNFANFMQKVAYTNCILGYLGNNTFAVWLKTEDGFEEIVTYVNEQLENFNTKYIDILPIDLYICTIPKSVVGTSNSEKLISIAEKALNRLKKENNITYYLDDQMYNELILYDDLVDYVIKSIENDQYKMVYQEKINTEEKYAYGVEVLSRLYRNDEFIRPDVFIKILEDSDKIIGFGQYVYNKVLADFKEIVNIYGENIIVSFNVSPKELVHPDFTDMLFRLLNQYNVSPSNIELEVTENVLITNLDLLLPVLKEIRDHGIVISLDDFGSGYSSLSYLVNLPVDIVKIDRSFMKDIETNEVQLSVISSVVNIAKAKKMNVVAEGVETLEQSNILKSLGCINVQGYYYSKPQSLELLKKN